MFNGDAQRRHIRLGELLGFAEITAAPNGTNGMDDEARLQGKAGSERGVAGGTDG